ncbi:MAG: SDR family NAD(P)-dependent oxidoreductase [Actinobacteria bacterium]|nr:MAG: SDR family NAD(P)-dependent oxidoreductase [Actinomycetota bacterium]
MRFDGRVAIVTGAGGNPGLGRSHARLLAERGAKVVVNDLGVGPDGRRLIRAEAEKVAAEINDAGGEAIADVHSVADEESARAVVQTALDAWGRVDILVNNAGVGVVAGFDEITPADIWTLISVHLMGAIWMCRAVWPHLQAAGYGRIVNTTSGGMLGSPGLSIYGAAKFGIFGLTRGLAVEGAAHNIRVNALSPGAATTSFECFYTIPDRAALQAFTDSFPPELVSPAVAYLAHESCELSGGLFDAGGGNVSASYIASSAGYQNPKLTIEDVRDNLAPILDQSALSVVTDPRDPSGHLNETAAQMVPKPYQPV